MTNKFKTLITTAVMITAFAIGAFAQNGALASKHWQLTHLNGKAVGQTKAYIEIDPASGRFTGNAGCNRMFGSSKVDGQNISFSGVGLTRMACVDSTVTKLEGDFTKAMEQATRYKVSGSTLSIYAGNQRIMKFKGEPRTGNSSSSGVKLEDKKWVLESIAGNSVGVAGAQAFISFDAAKGSAGGNTSCNVFGGNYTVKQNVLTIKEVISTMRACIEDDRMKIERSFLDALNRANRFEIKGDKFNLYKGNYLLLTFRGENK